MPKPLIRKMPKIGRPIYRSGSTYPCLRQQKVID